MKHNSALVLSYSCVLRVRKGLGRIVRQRNKTRGVTRDLPLNLRQGGAMRDTSRRRQEIIGMLNAEGSTQVLALSEQFRVSTQTIRTDLAFLEERGVLVRYYGGAV